MAKQRLLLLLLLARGSLAFRQSRISTMRRVRGLSVRGGSDGGRRSSARKGGIEVAEILGHARDDGGCTGECGCSEETG